MPYCRGKNSFLTPAVLTFAHGMDIFVPNLSSEQPMIQKIQQETADDANHHLGSEYSYHCPHRNRFRYKDWKHLIRGRKKHRCEGAGSDKPPRIEVGSGSGKPTLGKNTQYAAKKRPHLPCPADRCLGSASRLMLKPFHDKIGQKKKWQYFQCVQQCIRQAVK